MELKDGVIHALTIAAFPLQIVAWIFFAGRMELIVPIILSCFAHGLYYSRVIIRGEKQYRNVFFVYEIIVAIAMWVTFIVKLFGFFPEFWIFIVPMFVQVGACVGLYIQYRKAAEEDDSVDVIDERENERFKKGIMSAVAVFAFPTQLVFWSFMIANGDGVVIAFMIIAIIVSVTAHFLYFHNVIWRGKTQFKTHFFYFEVCVAIVQAMLLTMPETRCSYYSYYSCGMKYEDLWLAVLPLLVQVITCTYLYMEGGKTETEGVLPSSFKNMPREFTAFPVVSKTNDYEVL